MLKFTCRNVEFLEVPYNLKNPVEPPRPGAPGAGHGQPAERDAFLLRENSQAVFGADALKQALRLVGRYPPFYGSEKSGAY